MMTIQRLEKLLAERRHLLQLKRKQANHPKMKLVIQELSCAIDEIELELLTMVPTTIDRQIKDARTAPIEYTKRKPTEFDRRQFAKIYKHRSFICVRHQSDCHYPKKLNR